MFDRHQGIVNNLCRIYYKNSDDQRDTRQDIILQLWKSFTAFRGEAHIGTWIYRVSLNTILTKLRKEKRQLPRVSLDPGCDVSNGRAVSADDDVQLLHTIIASLREVDKAIVILHLEGYKNREIAKFLGLTATNISTRMNRIKSVIKAKFNIESHEIK